MHPSYVGRFAPSPSGPLHLGSLVSALASFLDAKHHGGKWLIRIEDVDSQRCKPAHSIDILDTLASYQLTSDAPVLYQSQQTEHYQSLIDQLIHHNLVFPCQCTRQELKHLNGPHTHICSSDITKPHAWRLISHNTDISFLDKRQGMQTQNPLQQIGHSIIKRKDLDYAYLLAVVADDHFQGITHVVRGYDLLDTTAAQINLFNTFEWNAPQYCHIPLVTDDNQLKLSKQNHAPAIPKANLETLKHALTLLNQKIGPPQTIQTTLDFAIKNWSLARV